MALMQITVVPLGCKSPSIGDIVADIQRMLAKQDLPYQLTDMGTIIQGEINDLLALAGKLHEQSFSSGIKRVVTQIVIDDRRDKSVKIGDKISSVRKRLD